MISPGVMLPGARCSRAAWFAGRAPAQAGDAVRRAVTAQRLDRVAQVAQQLAVLPARHVGDDRRQEAALGQIPADLRRHLIRPGRIPADVQQSRQRRPLRLDGSRLQVGRREPDAHPVYLTEAAQRQSLAGHPVLRAEHRQRPGRHGAAEHWRPGPLGEHSLGVLGLDGQYEDVTVAELEFGGLAHGGNGQRGGTGRGGQPQAARPQRVEMRAPGDQDDLVPALEQPAADGPGAGPVSVYVAPSWPGSVSVTAATAAISRTSTALTAASPIGAYNLPSAAIGRATASRPWKNRLGRTNV